MLIYKTTNNKRVFKIIYHKKIKKLKIKIRYFWMQKKAMKKCLKTMKNFWN